MLHIAQFISVILLTMFTGTLFGLAWATSKFSDKQFVQALQGMLPPLEKWFPPLCMASLASLIFLAVLERHTTHRFIEIIACACTVVIFMVITTKGNVPINIQLKKWDIEHLPSGWDVTFGRWRKYNNARSILIYLAFCFFWHQLFTSPTKRFD